MNMSAALIFCAMVVGCTAVHPDAEILRTIAQENERVERMQNPEKGHACPPIPEMPADADKTEARLFTYTLIALYQQCAKSKR